MSDIQFSKSPTRFGTHKWQLVPNSEFCVSDQHNLQEKFNVQEQQDFLDDLHTHPLRQNRVGINNWSEYIASQLAENPEQAEEYQLKINLIESHLNEGISEYHGYLYYEEASTGTSSKSVIIEAEFSRSLEDFSAYQRRSLIFLELMDEYGLLDQTGSARVPANLFLHYYMPLIWGDGQALIKKLNASNSAKALSREPKDLVQHAMNKIYGTVEASQADRAAHHAYIFFYQVGVECAWEKGEDAYFAHLRELYQEYATEHDLPVLPPLSDEYIANKGQPQTNKNLYQDVSLFLGLDENRQQVRYKGEGSVISIAAPRSGKTQTHILPNLLSWRAPAIVLDIKGELWQKSAGWRTKHVGRCIRFAPLEPENSHCYNPISQVRKELDFIWEDSVFLANMLLPRSKSGKDPFWEDQATRLIAAAIAASVQWGEPSLNFVHDVVAKDTDGWAKFMTTLRDSQVAAMRRSFSSFEHMDLEQPKTLAGILSTAQNALDPWQGERVERVTQSSDWTPDILRNADENVTLYINLRPGELDTAYAGILRVMVGQHIRGLMQHDPETHPRPILFLLDEMVRLGRMPIIQEALEVGAQYGVRLFPAIQYVDHLKTTVTHPEGFLGAFAARAYMNPTSADGTAEKLSREFGMIDSITDGRRKPAVEASDLTGEEYRDKVLVFAHGQSPIIANKAFAYQNPVLNDRMHIKPPPIYRQD